MTYCGKCGTKVEEGIKFCPGCGSEIVAEAAAEEKVNTENKHWMILVQCFLH